MTPKVNPTTLKDPPNLVLNVQADPDSYPGLSYYFLSSSYDFSDSKYHKQIRRTKNNKRKSRNKNIFDPIKKCAKLTAKLLIDV